MTEKYYVGLDMGTSSVGWAVTDDKYNLVRKKGKDLWGIREFEEAKTAAERRTHRISRRRNQRSQVRIGLVKDYFADEINKLDPYFYQRLENSKYHLEDKDDEVKSFNSIFNDKDYTDREYYKEYPTIFHLRKELIENDNAPYDIRLIYLAVLNLFKRRGNFLNSSLEIEENKNDVSISESYNSLVSVLSETFDSNEELLLPDIKEELIFNDLKNIFVSKEYSRTKKSELIAELLGIDKKQKRKYELIKAFCGIKVNYKKLFEIDNEEDKIEAEFKDFNYAEKEPELLEKLGDKYANVVLALKSLYDAGSLAGILNGYKFLSYARVDSYEQHKADLKKLKKVIKKYCPEEYNNLFRETENGTYSAYVNSTNNNGPKRRNMSGRKKGDFYSTIKKLLSDYKGDEDVSYILASIENEVFMPKQLTSDNGIIPNQVHARELKIILDNASKNYAFLNEKDESGLMVKERIIRLYTFTIPYYVGPVSKDSKTGWVIRKETGTIFPWNIEEKVDMAATRSEFINRMVRRCTYLNDEQVLPKASLMYEKFAVLNEINNIRIDNERIDNDIKKELFNELYKTGKKPTRKKLNQWFINNGYVESETSISGIDIEMNNSLSSYGKFAAIFADKIELDNYKEMIEDIIFVCTVYGESKKLIEEYIQKKYPEKEYPELNNKNIKRILGFKFKDWGRFSKELLCLQGCNKSTGEIYSILRAMWETNYNFMELINSDEFTFKDELKQKENTAIKSLSDFSVEMLDEYYFSAPVKKMINQTMLILQEIHKIMGGEPTKVFIEMTRSDEVKGDAGRKHSRKKQLLELYKNISNEVSDKKYWTSLIEKEDETGRLKSKKVYLYIRQLGRDMYTGKSIDIDKLDDYDIDHIYPRHYVKDDNLENNLVLVSREKNAEKSDDYPIPLNIRGNANVQALWRMLHEKGFINDTKYARLNSNSPFSDEQRAGFIARQLVETSQGTKGVKDILEQALPNSTIVCCKASNVSEFRKKFEFYKSRIVNDNHHANDAYLNIVVGNVYFTKFTNNPINFIKKEWAKDKKNYEYNLNKMYEHRIERNGEIAWTTGGTDEVASIKTVKKVMERNTPMLTRQSFELHGGLADQTLYGAEKAKADTYIPLKFSDEKMQDVKKYGGFSNVHAAYFFLVEHKEKGKVKRTLETVPLYLRDEIENNPARLEEYCRENLKLQEFSIRLRKIKIQSLFKLNGYFVHLSGKTTNRIILRNATPLTFCIKNVIYIKKIENYIEKDKLDDKISKDKNEVIYDEITEKHLNAIFKFKPNPMGELLLNGRDKFIELSLEEQCKVLCSIIGLTNIGTTSADLTKIGGAAKTGVMLTSKEISKNTEILLINQSVTGYYENVIDLRTV